MIDVEQRPFGECFEDVWIQWMATVESSHFEKLCLVVLFNLLVHVG